MERKLLIYIPGTSGFVQKTEEVLAAVARSNSYDYYSLSLWKTREELQLLNYEALVRVTHNELAALFSQYSHVVVVAKSFGATLFFHSNLKVDSLVLLGPFVQLSNYDTVPNVSLSTIESLSDIRVSKEHLENMSFKCGVVWGEKDEIVSADMKSSITKALGPVRSVTIPEMGHSPKTEFDYSRISAEITYFL